MQATFMYGAGDVRVESVLDPTIQDPTDAIVRVVRACIYGSDLHPYHSLPASEQGTPMGHELIGIVEDVGSAVAGLRTGDFVISPFAFSDTTCVFCQPAAPSSRCRAWTGRTTCSRACWPCPTST